MATKTGTARRDKLVGTDQGDTLIGLGGNDLIKGGDGVDFLFGDERADTDRPGGGADQLYGGGGNDFLAGGGGNDLLVGGDGDDRLVGGAADSQTEYSFSYTETSLGGDDSFDGGAGFDNAYIQFNRDADLVLDASDTGALAAITADGVQVGTITGVEQITVFAGAGDDRLTGGWGSDWLIARAGADVLIGGEGNDTLRGGAGDDVLKGGGGYRDLADFSDASVGVTVDLRLAGAQDTGQGLDTLSGIEGVIGTYFSDRLTGTNGNDSLFGSYGGSDVLDGRGGDDFITVNSGFDTDRETSKIFAGAGNDRAEIISAGVERHVSFFGGQGDDDLTVYLASDLRAVMGQGDDRVAIQVGKVNGTLSLGTGVDTIALQAFELPPTWATARVDDFEAGARGDIVELGGVLYGLVVGYEEGDNPFASGHFALARRGEDTALLFDRDGTAGAGEAKTVLLFADVQPAAFGAENFGGFDPRAAGFAIDPVLGPDLAF